MYVSTHKIIFVVHRASERGFLVGLYRKRWMAGLVVVGGWQRMAGNCRFFAVAGVVVVGGRWCGGVVV